MYHKIIAFLLVFLDLALLLFVNPYDLTNVFGERETLVFIIILQGVVVFSVISIFLDLIDQLIFTFGLVFFLLITNFLEFQIIHTILLISFIIIIRIILHRRE